MSWFVIATPLHACPADALEWAREQAIGDVPEQPPVWPLPSVKEVLGALREAGCHGDAWYTIDGEPDPHLPICPDRHACDEDRGLDLGEVSIDVDQPPTGHQRIGLDDRVTSVSFRKPRGGLLHACLVLAGLGGHQLVFDDNLRVVVVAPDDRIEDLAATWPWQASS